jgi:hypothetical protein
MMRRQNFSPQGSKTPAVYSRHVWPEEGDGDISFGSLKPIKDDGPASSTA